MPTGDGLLARLRPAAPIPLDAMIGFCEAARRHGNGTIEISARGSLQVRGLTPRSAPLFASAVAELGIAAHEGVPVIAAFDLPSQVNMPGLLGELRQAIANARLALSSKISVVVDCDSALHLDAVSADVRLRMAAPARGTRFYSPRFYLGLGGDGASATWLGTVALEDAVGAVLGILTIIAAHGPTARTAAVLRGEGVEAFRLVSVAIIEPSPAPPQRIPVEMIGLHPAHNGAAAVGIGLAFGHTDADALADVVRVAASHGARAVWPAPDRAMLLIGIPARGALDLRAAAERLGFVVRAGDPRRRIAACPGSPACASGLIPARALGAALHTTLEHGLGPGRGIAIHISGCPKGCAHPMPATFTVVGTPSGCGIIHRGSARMTPSHYVDPANLGDEISRIATKSKEAAHG
jgi:precorrin-3B synthase